MKVDKEVTNIYNATIQDAMSMDRCKFVQIQLVVMIVHNNMKVRASNYLIATKYVPFKNYSYHNFTNTMDQNRMSNHTVRI